MKVLILTNDGAGLYKFRSELIGELIKPGTYIDGRKAKPCEVFISLPNGEFIQDLKKLGCIFINTPIDRRGMNPLRDLRLMGRYVAILKHVNPDIVLTYTIKPNIYGGLVCGLARHKYIANVTGLGTSIESGTFMSKVILQMYKAGLRSAKTIFFQNELNFSVFKQKKISRGNGRLIPGSGVNLDEHCLEKYPDESLNIRFLFIGRVMRDKGIVEFLDCAEFIKEKYPDIEFDILGDFDEAAFKIRVRDMDRRGIIHYYGSQKDVHSFIKTHHATILPSYHEGLSNVLLETAAAGRPVIAANVSGCAETFDDGISGIGFAPKSSKALIEAVESFISIPYDKKREMGTAARKKIEKKFDRRFVIDSYIEAISNALEERKNVNL